MYQKNGILFRGRPPEDIKGHQRIVKHHSQKTQVASPMKRLDAFLKDGVIRACFQRKLGGLGDIIMATPIAKGTKRKYPKAHVTFAVPTEYGNGDLAALLYHNPYIDEIIDYRLVNRDDYEIFADITSSGLSEERAGTIPRNRIDIFADEAGIPLFGDTLPTYVMTKEEEEQGKAFVKECLGRKEPRGKIAIQLRSNDPKRTWPKHHVRDLISLAHDKGYECFLFEWGHNFDNEWEISGCNQVFNRDIRFAASVMKQCDILVCPDSSLLHLGGALNMKIVSIFGSMPPACRINHYPNAIALVNARLACLGCIYAPCINNYFCMSSITGKEVLSAVQKHLQTPCINPGSDDALNSILPAQNIENIIPTFTL